MILTKSSSQTSIFLPVDDEFNSIKTDIFMKKEQTSTNNNKKIHIESSSSNTFLFKIYNDYKNKKYQSFNEDFWKRKTVDDLAIEQGLTKPRNFSDLVGGWPEDESFEEFVEALKNFRKVK